MLPASPRMIAHAAWTLASSLVARGRLFAAAPRYSGVPHAERIAEAVANARTKALIARVERNRAIRRTAPEDDTPGLRSLGRSPMRRGLT